VAHRAFYGIYEMEKVTKMNTERTQIELAEPLIELATGRRYWWIINEMFWEHNIENWPTEHYMAYLRWKKQNV
jgi:hypothetical protein